MRVNNFVRRSFVFASLAFAALIALTGNLASAQVVPQGSIGEEAVVTTVMAGSNGNCGGAYHAELTDNGRAWLVTYIGGSTNSKTCSFTIPGFAMPFGSTPGFIDGIFVVSVDGVHSSGAQTIDNPSALEVKFTSAFVASWDENLGPRP